MRLMVALLAVVTSAVANNPPRPDSSARTSNVKNAPFSADVITQYDRTLDNGGHIHRESRGKIFRDSQGRMRTETEAAAQPVAEKYDHITINDPIRQVIICLNPKTKTATVVHFGEIDPNPPIAATKQPKTKQKPKTSIGGQSAVGSGPADTLAGPGIPSGPGNTAQPVQQSGAPTSKMDSTIFSNSSGATTVPLGTKMIEGVSATGTRTTRTLDPGTMGNDKPIVSICDTWVSTDLKVTILTETDDGQAGRSTMKLVRIVRSEPNAALFQIPADYKLQENARAASVRP